MIVERMDNIKSLKTFISDHKCEKIILKNLLENNFHKMKSIISICKEVDEFLQIEIGKDFFYIYKVDCKSGNINHYLTSRTLKEIIMQDRKSVV